MSLNAKIKAIKNLERYKDFTFLGHIEDFSEVFKGKDFDIVQVHDTTLISDGKDIVGFAGAFKWEGNKLTPLDGDSYTSHAQIFGYEEFKKDGMKGLDVLAEEW